MSTTFQFLNYQVCMERGTHPLILGRTDTELCSLACDMRHKQFVEIRILLGERGDQAKIAEFSRLASRAAQLGWSGAMPEVIDFGEDGGSLFYVFPFRDGESLDSYLSHVLSLNTATVLSWASGLAQAISSLGATPSLQARCGQADHKVVLDGDRGAKLQLRDLGLARALADDGVRPEQGLENAFRVVGAFLQRVYEAQTVAGRPVVTPIRECGLPDSIVASVEQLIGIDAPTSEIPSLAALRQVLMEAEVAAADLNEALAVPPPHLVLDRFVEGSEEFTHRAARVGIDVGSIRKAFNRYACEFIDPENGERRVRQPLPPRAFLGGLDLDAAGQKLSSLDPDDVPNLMRVYELADAGAPVQGYIEESVGGATLATVLDAAGGRVSAWELSPLLEQLHEALLQAEANSLLPARITLDDIFWEPRERKLKLRVLPTTAALAGHRWRPGERFEVGQDGSGTGVFVKLALGLLGGRMMNGGVVLPESAPAGLAAQFAEFLVPGGAGEGRLNRQRFLSSWSEIVGKLDASSAATLPSMLSPQGTAGARSALDLELHPAEPPTYAGDQQGADVGVDTPSIVIGAPAAASPAQVPVAAHSVTRPPRLAPQPVPVQAQAAQPAKQLSPTPQPVQQAGESQQKMESSAQVMEAPPVEDLHTEAPVVPIQPSEAAVQRTHSGQSNPSKPSQPLQPSQPETDGSQTLPPVRRSRRWGALIWCLLFPLFIALAGWAYFTFFGKGDDKIHPEEMVTAPPVEDVDTSLTDPQGSGEVPVEPEVAPDSEPVEEVASVPALPGDPGNFPEPSNVVAEPLPDLEVAQGVLDQGTPPAPDTLPSGLPQPPSPDASGESEDADRLPVPSDQRPDHLMSEPPSGDDVVGASDQQMIDDGPGFIDAEANNPAGNLIAAAKQFSSEGKTAEALGHYMEALELEAGNITARTGLEEEFASLMSATEPLGVDVVQQLERAASAEITGAKSALGHHEMLSAPALPVDEPSVTAGEGDMDVSEMLALGEKALSAESGEDLEEAAKWFDLAAEAGDARGLYLSGECHLLGKGVPENLEKAISRLEKAASMDEPRALDLLGVCLVRGMGFEKNPTRARELFTRALEAGNLGASANLGSLWINGEGGPKDAEKAAKYFKMGAEGGNKNSMFYLAQCYELGLGAEADPAGALGWYRRAAADGHMASIAWCEENGVRWKK